MDPIMQLKRLALAAWAALAAVALGTDLGVMWLFERRDRRQSTLLGHVRGQLASDELRPRVGISVRYALLGWKGVVTLNMRACSRDEVWETTSRVSRSGDDARVGSTAAGSCPRLLREVTPPKPSPAASDFCR